MYNREVLTFGSLCVVNKLTGCKDQRVLKVKRIGKKNFYLEGCNSAFSLIDGIGISPECRGHKPNFQVVKILNPAKSYDKKKRENRVQG